MAYRSRESGARSAHAEVIQVLLFLAIVICARGTLADAQKSRSPAPDVRRISGAALAALPADAVVQFEGRSLTKVKFVAEIKKRAAKARNQKRPGPENSTVQLRADAESLRRKFMAREQTRIASENAKVQASVSRKPLKPVACADPGQGPKITSVVFTNPLEPGEYVWIHGCHFGASHPANQVRLLGESPGGYLKLDVLSWNDKQVHAKLGSVTGVKDHHAKLQVVSAGIMISDEWPVDFYATRELKRLSFKDVIVSCGYGSTYMNCPRNPDTWRAAHYGVDGVNDADIAEASLSNGYVSAGYAWGWSSNHDLCFMEEPILFKVGVPDLKIAFPYVCDATGPKDGVGYNVELYVIGPAGVSY